MVRYVIDYDAPNCEPNVLERGKLSGELCNGRCDMSFWMALGPLETVVIQQLPGNLSVLWWSEA